MAKSASKKTAKSNKGKKSTDTLVDDIKGKLKTSKKDLTKQVKALSKELAEFKDKNSAKKIIKKLEKKYRKESDSLKKEFNEKVAKLQEIQANVLEKLPSSGELKEKLKLTPSISKPAAKDKPPTKIKPTKAKAELAAIKGIGPVTIKKLEAAGIHSLDDLAYPSASTQQALKSFDKIKGSETWTQQAKDILVNR